uniref:Uncharacterized protein n=1 Tax=Aegilops tauschii subsp. strangulata TaxID=200361 RepID=A0A453ECB1_AEGTS
RSSDFRETEQTMGAAPSRQEASTASSPTGDGRVEPTALSASTPSDTANQAQSKRAPAPHVFREIVAGENVADIAALEDQVSKGIFLAGKTKKYWVDERTRHNCFMLFPRGLHITWSEDPKYWTWHPLKEGRLVKNHKHVYMYTYLTCCSEPEMFKSVTPKPESRRWHCRTFVGWRSKGSWSCPISRQESPTRSSLR